MGTETNEPKHEIEALRELARFVDRTKAKTTRELQAAIDASKELMKRAADKSE